MEEKGKSTRPDMPGSLARLTAGSSVVLGAGAHLAELLNKHLDKDKLSRLQSEADSALGRMADTLRRTNGSKDAVVGTRFRATGSRAVARKAAVRHLIEKRRTAATLGTNAATTQRLLDSMNSPAYSRKFVLARRAALGGLGAATLLGLAAAVRSRRSQDNGA